MMCDEPGVRLRTNFVNRRKRIEANDQPARQHVASACSIFGNCERTDGKTHLTEAAEGMVDDLGFPP